ncbi:hypothetical protein CEQ90_11570 [Lewinellaceae bacterium SD302]|nr:hypothetical protein CEQ90_11570 [Lewinellaceae bacterium SD302]
MTAKSFKSILLFLCLLGTLNLCAQSAEELKNRRNKLIRDLKSTTQQLDRTKAQKSKAIKSLNLLQQQIEQRRELIETLNQEVELTNTRIADNQDILNSLGLDLERMRSEYASTLRAAYRNKMTNGWLGFLLSADGFNDAFRRYNYLRQYQRYRRNQGRLIVATQESMRSRTIELEIQRVEKEELLIAASEQGQELESALQTQVGLVDELSGEEKKLFARVKQQQREQAALDAAIEKAIAEEIATRASSKLRNSGDDFEENIPAIGKNFAEQRGHLNWPVQGSVIKPFGKQPHPDVPSVTIYNGGIDLDATAGARVQAVFTGKVISIRQIPGYRNTVMVRHGDYYTVYSNLEKVIVIEGDEVELGTSLGFTSQNGDPLHFELWRGKERQDPGRWLH